MWCPHPPKERKKKNYGFAQEILCSRCWRSLSVTSNVDSVRGKWLQRFLNELRSSMDKSGSTTLVEMPDGRAISLINTYMVRSLAKQLHMDEDTLWRYSLLLEDQNVDGKIQPTAIPYDGHHRAIKIVPAERECEPWPYAVADLSVEAIQCDQVIGRARDFTLNFSLDYYFDEPTEVFLGVKDGSGWLGQERLTLTGSATYSQHLVAAKTPPEPGEHTLELSCFYSEQGEWIQTGSIPFTIKVEDISNPTDRVEYPILWALSFGDSNPEDRIEYPIQWPRLP